MLRRHAAALIALAISSFAVQAQSPEWKKIRIGVEGAYPPFSEVGPDGKLKGFEIDLAMAFCALMQAQCTLIQQDFDGLIPALQAKKFDAIIASVSITDERKKAVQFSHAYYNTPARFVGKLSAPLEVSAAGLKGKKIGVQRATIYEAFASATFKQSEVKRYTKQDEVFLDMTAGRIDGTLMDSVAADAGFLQTPAGKGFGFVGPTFTDKKFFGDGVGVAMRKADTALAKKFNEAIATHRASGATKALADKYFKYDILPK